LKAAGLFSVAPDFDFVFTRQFGLDHLAANCCGRFFAAAIVRSKRAVNVVVAGDAGLQPVVFAKMPAHPFGKEFLQP
jgi:hypothetical protein